MDIKIIETMVGNLGFPIAVCVALFWNNRKTVEHYERILLQFKTTIEDNTRAMNSLCNRVNKG